MYCGDLKVNSTTTISFGPALDKDDADTEKTATIADTEFFLSKNGGNLANPNDTNDATHDQDGMFNKQLDTTDLNTEGLLTIIMHKADHLYTRQDYTVLSEAAYEFKYTAKDTGVVDVHVKTIEPGIIANASFNADVQSTAYATNIIALAVFKAIEEYNLDHLVKTTTGVAADGDLTNHVADGTILSHLMTKGADTSDFKATTDSQEGQRDTLAPASEYDTQLDANMSTRAPANEYDTEMARITANVATSAELAKIPKSDGSSSWNATALSAIQSQNLAALQSVQLDHLAGVTTGIAADGDLSTYVVDGTILSHLMTKGADTSDFKASTESLEGLRDQGDSAWITGGDATEAKQDTIIAAVGNVPTADEVWNAIGSETSLSFEVLLERAYQFFCNELEIVDATGGATLRNFGDDGDMATWTITDDDTTTDRTAISWV